MALKGRLRDFGLSQLLNLIHLARKSGTLALRHPEGSAELFFHEGKLVYATRGGEPDGLAELMVRARKISARQAQMLEASGKVKDDRQLGLLLINAGRASRTDILKALRHNMLEIVRTVLGWEDGAFLFDQKGTPPRGRITIPIGLESIVIEGSRKQEQRKQAEPGALPDGSAILRFTDGKGSNLGNIQLSVEEWRVISFINPHNTLQSIAQYNQMTLEQVQQVAAKLLRDQLVQVVGAGSEASAAPTPPTARPTPAPVTPAPGRPAPRPLIQRAAPAPVAEPRFMEPEVERGIIRKLITRIRNL